MNGDMPHVPITTLAGIASLTDLLNQLPLPSPLPATTAKSLLYNGRISEEVSSLLVCRDENLVTQLAHSLNQVSTEHIELKDNLGNDEPEGDMPLLLQTLLSRNPKIFRDKSVMQQPMMQQYKMSQNQVHGSPGSNYQQTSVPQSPSGCFASPQSGSGARFLPQQNSPIPSPYTPQSPADYMQYNPPSYSQHQQTQQVRNIHDDKVSGQLSSTSSNHNARLGSDEDYINTAHRLGNEENDPSMRAATFPVKSPESVCSPAGSEETAKTGSRPPLIMQSPPPDMPPVAAPDSLLTSADRKKKQKERSKEENDPTDRNASYDIVSSPAKESARLTIKLSRVKLSEMDPSGELPLRPRVDSEQETDLTNNNNNNNQLSRTTQDLSHKFGAEEQANCKQVPVRPNSKESGVVGGVVFDDAEIDTLAEIERIERESASEKERWSKEVQDKDKPLKKRKQDTYPQESGAESSDGPAAQGGNTDGKLKPKKTNAASNGASRPALMVSIDLQQAGRMKGQPVVLLEAQTFCEDHLRHLKPKTDGKVDKVAENRPGIIRQHADNPKKPCSDGQPEAPKQKPESQRESKHKHDGKTVGGKKHSDDKRPDTPRQKHDKHSDLRHKEEKNHNIHRSHVSNPETPKTLSKGERISKHGEAKLIEGWSEPLVRLERLSLIKNLNKGAKPVVVLNKLNIDEVKRIIKESRNAHGSRSSDKSGRENKRKHSMISKKPKYAELDEDDEDSDHDDDDDSDNESPKKRSKKDHDKSWKQEEKKGSGQHRSGGLHGARRGSSSCHRERSPNDSDADSPPPSLRDVARKLKKKEKQKNKKAYDSKLTPEEKIDSSTFKRFTANMESIIESLDDVDLAAADDDEIPEELLLGKHQLSELGNDSAKIKAMCIFNKCSTKKLVKLLNILEKNIQDSVKLSTLMNHENDSMDEERLWRDLIIERVAKSADACLTALNIMTSPHMPKAVYIEDVIERVLQYTKFHLQNSLYPQYDPVYRRGGMHTSKSKRAKISTHKQKVVVMLYDKVCDIVSSISELLEIQLLTDTTILQVSTLGITPFFVENVSELQLCAITLVTAVFCRYEKHRQLILEEIFTSLARLPTSKRSLRNFRLNNDSDDEPLYIQMVSALVLQLIQCVVRLPSERDAEGDHNKKVDKDVFITNSYETAMRTAQNFLSVFLKKCGSKQGEDDYRPLFENFVHDLLSTVNRPEWPAAELLLSLLGRLLVHQFSNKQTEMALRVASLDYLGTVASSLRKDAVNSNMDQKAIDRILRESQGSDEVPKLQKALLDYLNENIETDPSLVFARKFYIAQWFRDTITEAEKAVKSQNDDEDFKGRHPSMDVDSTEEILQRGETRKKFLRKIMKTSPSDLSSSSINSDTVDYGDSCLIVRYLASMRPFSQSFDIYLSQILRVLGESAIAVRTKAMKCLSEVVAVDPSILARLDMQRGVHCRLMDNSTSVREAAVELLGRFVLSRPQLIEQYYDMLIERILDTGISVRKRVIKILRDICLELPDFHKITEMCVRMIRRVNDEEGIKKLVNETFQKIWFTPTPGHDKNAMTRKILNITDVVLACKDSGYDWFEQLLQNLLKSEEQASYKPAKKACVQLVDNLVEHILKYEESIADCEDKGVNSGRLVSCVTTLYLFSKIRAQLMVKHAMTMQPYLTTKCSTQNDFMVICNVAKILELVVPLMEHPSETFLTTLEEDLMKLIIKYGMTVVQHSVSCLGAVVNKVTHNYKFVWACFNRYYGALAKLKTQHQEDPNSSTLAANKPTLLRALFTVGALCRHFDFDQEEFKGTSKIVIKDKVLELLLYFTTHEDEEVQIKAITGLGFQFIMYPELMFVQDVKVLYNNTLSDESSLVTLKIQVLKNLQTYLQEEDSRMQKADCEWKKQSNQEDLKEMGDISSGMSSSIMQIYLKQVLESFFHSQSTVRHFSLSVITLTLSQGLVHPVQCVPYLIAMGTDPEPTMKNKSDQQLVEIDKKYTGFIHMKAVAGLKMSYQVQQAINGSKGAVIRGFRHDDTDISLCSHLYTLVRGNRQYRRAFLISLLNLFDDSSKTEVNRLLFIADNLAYFPYQTQEEPLFIMHHVDITLSVSGSNLLQSFKESLQKGPVQKEKKTTPTKKMKTKKKKMKKTKKPQRRKHSSDDDDDEDGDDDDDNEEEDDEQSSSSSSSSDEEDEVVHKQKKPVLSDSDGDMEDEDTVMHRLPENPNPLLDFASASQGILMLLVLKQHLKNLFGFSDSKIQKYSPTESAKVYDKAVNRKSKVHFNPRQTLDYLKRDLANSDLSDEIKRNIVKQYLDFKVLMEHLDRDEEDEEGEASANARNKAITSLLKVPKPSNQNQNHSKNDSKNDSRNDSRNDSKNDTAPVETDEEESEDEDLPVPQRKPKKGGESAEDTGHMNERVKAMDIIAIWCPKYKDRPQIARVIQRIKTGYSIHWMTGSYSSSWVEVRKREGRKKVPWVDTIKESDIIYKKIPLTSGHKLTNKVAQTLRALYAAKDGE
ncbi:hypothetical protein VZT92_009788 [Zoarces viviparus]|uniref:Nipped-B protein n=1 Tax=Zoarces viviparus TaxID=48416 RepID=A0AAW1FCV8_ZOAVI